MKKIFATLLLSLLAVTITVFGLTSCLDDPTETAKDSVPVDSGEELSDSSEELSESESESDEPATTYIITWMNGEIELGTTEVEENELPVYDGETPVKAADAQYTYTFNGWAPEIVAATEDATYTATYTETVNTYMVTWKDGDGNTLDTDEVAYGEVPAYTGETPTKTATAQYTYTHSGWAPAVTAVTGDATYTATYTETVNNYTVTFDTNGGNEIAAASVPYGTASSAMDEIIPTKAGYAFVKWQLKTGEDTYVDLDGTETVTENITVKAVWTANTYYATFKNGEETVGDPVAYTVETASITEPAVPAKEGYTGAWETYDLTTVGGITVNAVYTPIIYTATIDRVVGDDEEVEFTIENRATILAGITLTADTDEWAYSWVEDLPEVLALNNTQVFTETRAKQTYVITWKNDNGDTLETDSAVEYGATPEYNGDTPMKTGYTFADWSPAVTAVTGTADYIAIYTANEYTLSFTDGENAVDSISVTYDATLSSLPSVPEKTGYYGVWQIDGVAISSSTIWNYTTDKTAVAVRGELDNITFEEGLDVSLAGQYDYNYGLQFVTPSSVDLVKYKLYEEFRKTHKDIPIIMVSSPNPERIDKDGKRVEIIRQSYLKAKESGDNNIYFIDGKTLFGKKDRENCTVDGSHPNDLGFYRMAKTINKIIKEIL
ncbi:MAG: InlB B-repeat-containing protein [Clostridia bacterium]|nr:InlB B-repeat-containing protein [Clostridia bacterium]